jgi:serine/threonine-protein kinase
MAADLIGGRYRLDSLLGQSGMSEVWCAEDLELGRRVALKLLAPDADRERFAREARAAAALAHPNITQLYDYGEADGRPFMVLEYLPGGSLEEQLEPNVPLPDADVARVAADVASGLAHAHARGLVHRDLKPANILFDAEGRAKIADFGIARLGQGGTLTEAGTVLGTAAYISPEQAGGEAATPASDVYSFGVILYRLLAGRLPFVSDDALTLVSQHRHATPPPLEEIRADAPPVLAALAAAALAKDSAGRPRDGAALVAALGGAAATVGPTAFPGASAPVAATDAAGATAVLAPAPATEAWTGPPRRRRRAFPFAIAGILALLAAGGAALAFTATHSGGNGPATTPPTVLPVAKVNHPNPARHHATTAAAAVASTTAPTAATTTATTQTTHPTTTHRTTTTTVVTLPPTPTVAPVTTAPPVTTDTTTVPPPTTAPTSTTGP